MRLFCKAQEGHKLHHVSGNKPDAFADKPILLNQGDHSV